MNGNSAFYTDHQESRLFLCENCEQRFTKYGEDIVIKEAWRPGGNFPLLDRIKTLQPIEIENLRGFIPTSYDTPYLYFALSIVWRSSAWPKSKFSIPNSLGSFYQETFRRYLLGESDFPDNVYLAVMCDNKPNYLRISFPTVTKYIGYHQYIFYIPGMRFSLIVGSQVGAIEQFSRKYSTNLFFIEYEFERSPDFEILKKLAREKFKPAGRLAKEIAKNRAN